MSWRPALWTKNPYLPRRFDLVCPYCGLGDGYYDVDRDSARPDPRQCSECDRTYIIPVTISRGGVA